MDTDVLSRSSVDDAVRQLLREEIRSLAGHPSAPPRPSAANVLWAALALLNVALVVWSVSPAWLSDERFKILADVLPWVGATFFAVAVSWFRETIATWASTLSFRLVNVAVLSGLSLLQLPLIPIRVDYQPPSAQLTVDGRPWPAGGNVRLGPHRIQLVAPNGGFQSGPEFELSAGSLVRQVVVPPEADYRWRLKALLSVNVDDEDAGARIVIAADRAFTEGLQASPNVLDMIDSRSNTEVAFQTNKDSLETEVVGWFPVGVYRVTAARDGCDERTDIVTLERAITLKFPLLDCGGRR